MSFPVKNEFIEAANVVRVLQENPKDSRKAFVLDVLERAAEAYSTTKPLVKLELCTQRLAELWTEAIVEQVASCSERIMRMQHDEGDTSIHEEMILSTSVDTLKAMIAEYSLILHHKLIVAVEG